MKSSNRLLMPICITLSFLTFNCTAQDKTEEDKVRSGPAYINLSLEKAPAANAGRHELSLYGCNTEVTTRNRSWNGKKNLEWGVDDQVMTGVPHGWQETRGGRKYYVSKYYMASPPVFDTLNKGYRDQIQRAIIGLVIPDQFTLFGERPVQKVNLDYTILEPVFLNYVGVDYDYVDEQGNPSASDLGLNLVPLNIQCKDFRWLNNGDTYAIMNARGASGIARIKNEKGQRQVFLPSYKPNGEDCLDCEITILDDILMDHEVFFVHDDRLVKTISLTDFYKTYGSEKKIQLFCRLREELPAGCRETKN
jgi:hypothetical protein